MPARRFDAIMIDFYGTITAGDREAVQASCRRVVKTLDLRIPPENLAVAWGERFFAVVDKSNDQAFRTLDECVQISLREALDTFGVDADPAPLVIDLEAYWQDPPIHEDAFDFLEKVDLPVCCVSNADTSPLMAAIERHGLRFDAIITSQDSRSYKPAPGIFLDALSVLSVTPDRAVHIGDSLHSDIGGASALGLSTAWICREDRIHDIGTSQPTFTYSTLTDAHHLISRRHPGS